MPHKFEAHPAHPAVNYLVRLHADIGGKMLDNKKEAERLAEAAKNVEAVIKLFNPDFDAKTIAARRRQATNPWFKRGTLFREALGILRTATAPMTCREIVDAVLKAKSITADKRQWAGIEQGIRATLEDHAGKSVERIEGTLPKRWTLRA
jgi:hypothetical protein